MRRGFKAWCERTAVEYREALGISSEVALDPRAFAAFLSVRVVTPQDFPGLSRKALEQLTVTDPDSWSAITISQRGIHLVILNSSQPVTRQANSLVHELAHIILNHKADNAQVSAEGILFRAQFNKEQEDEAAWLAGCLLVPAEGLLDAYRRVRSPRLLAQEFGVSQPLVEWRLRMTGIQKRMGRARRSSNVGW